MDYDGNIPMVENLRDARRIQFYHEYLSAALQAIRFCHYLVLDVIPVLCCCIAANLKCGELEVWGHILKSKRETDID